jgi:hypothetical protein
MRASFIVLILALFVIFAYAGDYHGQKWQQQSASIKFQDLTKEDNADPATAGYPSTVEEAELFVEGMPLTFDTVADDMPMEVLGFIRRKKLLHAVGLVASAVWKPVSNSLGYTGIFASGSQDLIVRLSTGNQPSTEGNSSGMIPAVALKFLRDGVPSGNIHLLGGGPQDSFNFFAHDFSNHSPDFPFNSPPAALVLRDLFLTASAYPTYVGLSRAAELDSSGQKPSGTPNYPWRIILHPSAALHNAFPDSNPNELWYKQLPASISPGTIFTVWAIDSPLNDNAVQSAVQIAEIISTTTFAESSFGDTMLFYQHTGLEVDFKYKPSWAKLALQVQNWQRNQTTQYAYQDLPWVNENPLLV